MRRRWRFRIAAIRETFEESGILLARPKGSKALVDAKTASEIEAAHRADLCDGKITFLKVLTDNGMLLALDELVPYAHWITPEGMPKRFDTWFFLAAAPPEQVGAHDGKESTDSIWVSPREALEGGETGRFKLPFPTTRNLIKLGKQSNVKAALDDSQGQIGGHRDAGHDQKQRRPPAHDSARGRLRRQRVRGRRAGGLTANAAPSLRAQRSNPLATQRKTLFVASLLAMTGASHTSTRGEVTPIIQRSPHQYRSGIGIRAWRLMWSNRRNSISN